MKKILFLTTLIMAISFIYWIGSQKEKGEMILKVGYPGNWHDLIPSLQHTAYADDIMHNQFETLVVIGRNGKSESMAAKSWSISDDKRSFTFNIDTTRKFSNGVSLSATHFKEAWEYSLTIDPKSSNNSLLDVLYKIKGFEDYEKNGEISGIKVIDDSTLRIDFQNTFRIGLNHLAGTRMAAFIREGNKFLGTGPYVINPISSEELLLTKNNFYEESIPFDKVSVKVVPPQHSRDALGRGEIDLYKFAEIGYIDSCFDKNVECISGSENRHIAIALNGMKKRLLSNTNHRKALQYLFFESFTDKDIPEEDRLKIQIDPQIFLPLQAGRLEDKEASRIIHEGKKYVDDFIKATHESPLYLAVSNSVLWYKSYLEKKGVQFSENSIDFQGEELAKMYYKTFEPDMMISYKSVFDGDPDGIYHTIGEKGAISSPMLYRKDVLKLLEEGRKILSFKDLSSHYEKVARAFLHEIPFIHVGFLKEMSIIRKDSVKSENNYNHRNSVRFTSYHPMRK